MSKLLVLLQEGLRKLANQHTCETLGDRATYLGASEVGQCPRKTILSKLHPVEHDLHTLLRFRRGHLAEDVVAEALTAMGWKLERQVEIRRGDIVAHLDFVFTSEASKTKSVLEVKSPENPLKHHTVPGKLNFISRWGCWPWNTLVTPFVARFSRFHWEENRSCLTATSQTATSLTGY